MTVRKVTPIDRDGGLPLYLQIEERIRMGIAGGAWRAGDILPTEEEMCRTFGVSRGPVRQALARLAAAGVIVRERRNGTRVLRGANTRGLILVTPFTAIQTAGMVATARVLSLTTVPTPPEVSERWKQLKHAESIRFERVFLANGVPVAYADSYLPASRFSGLARLDLVHHGLMDLVHQHYGVTLTRLNESMELGELPDRQAELLGLPPHTEGLHVTLTQWEGEEAVECGEFWLEPAKSRFLITGLLGFKPDNGCPKTEGLPRLG